MITDGDSPTTIAAAIGAFVRDYRARHGITREALARAGAAFGLNWGPTSIENIEAGRFAPTLQALYVLRAALESQARNREPLSLIDMLPMTGELTISDDFAVPAVRLRNFLTGTRHNMGEVEAIGDWIDEHRRSLNTPPPKPSLAEKRAAARLGISVDDFQDMALILWTKSLDDVVKSSAGPGASAQARGHETRYYVAELEENLPELKRRLAEIRKPNDG